MKKIRVRAKLHRSVLAKAGYPSSHSVWKAFPEGADEVVVEAEEITSIYERAVIKLGTGGCILSDQATVLIRYNRAEPLQ